ncbi:4-carboxymuconolactone decarboxylase [Kocuria soli]|uniref:4-carboxymuconolactone decarboxylase n=1 Tax=Kocuria soli TaxID=2485125 RepID=A0A3N3ZNS8_9MICC|nr:carboxymuconolactone decarboxylase family protein [Kocuria soli]ROZ62540.1 4-carboxymuconolactone decarboxylase [Kocuria soli]
MSENAAGPGPAPEDPGQDRVERSEEVFERLFGVRDRHAPEKHPEFMQILRSVIFGDVFATGDLDDRTRELVTVSVLGALQTLPQLRAHSAAALNVGVKPVELLETVYQLAPLIGFPRALNAIGVVSEVLTERGHTLPLPTQGTVDDDDRHARGLEIQRELYGDEIAESTEGLPGEFASAVPGFLTDFHFGDFWTRGGLDVATRELLLLVAIAAAGLTPQLEPHVAAAVRAGNDVETVLAALVQGFPYMGYPVALNAIRQVQAYLREV